MADVVMENVTVRYGEKVIIDRLSLTVKDGESFALLGPSACGKTTLLRALCGFVDLQEGQIYIDNKLVATKDKRSSVVPEKRDIGVVFQDYAVWPHLTVYQNVVYPLRKRKLPKSEAQARALQAIEQVRMKGYEKRLPAQLSGGQQQRVALARALVSSSQLIVLDEPITNLDANLREEMRFEIKELQRKTGITVLYITHDQEVALAIADRLAIMDNDGYIRQIGQPEEVYQNPKDAFIYKFLGISNFIRLEKIAGDYVVKSGQDKVAFPYPIPNTMTSNIIFAACRPVDIRLNIQPDEGNIKGLVKHVVYLGNIFEYRVLLGEEEIRVQQDSHEALRAGVPEEGEFYSLSFRNLRFYTEAEGGHAS